MHNVSDFRSDTVTKPTPEMYEAMAKAEVGDDVLGDDAAGNRLEAITAERLGKGAGLYVSSPTPGTQIGLALHCKPGDELICEFGAHTYNNESGAMARIACAQPRPIKGKNGVMDATEEEHGGSMKYDDLRQLKEEFYDWCALLSIDEVVSNRSLIGAIKRVEHSLIEAIFTPQAFFVGAQN